MTASTIVPALAPTPLAPSPSPVDVSVLVPAKDEAENLPLFMEQADATFRATPNVSFEVVATSSTAKSRLLRPMNSRRLVPSGSTFPFVGSKRSSSEVMKSFSPSRRTTRSGSRLRILCSMSESDRTIPNPAIPQFATSTFGFPPSASSSLAVRRASRAMPAASARRAGSSSQIQRRSTSGR